MNAAREYAFRGARRLLVLVGAALGCSGWSLAADVAAPDSTEPAAWQVYQVLHAACVECHGGHLSKPKAQLGYILDLARLIEEGYVNPGDPERSDLYTALVTTDEDVLMPPLDSDGHRPTPEEIETIHAWIAGGARLTETSEPSETAAEQSPPAAVKTGHSPLRVLGRFHHAVVHFPIALLLCAAFAEVAGRVRTGSANWWHGTTRGCLWIAAISSILATVLGWIHAAQEGYASGGADLHRWLGVATTGVSILAVVVVETTERIRAGRSRGLLLAVLLAATFLVVYAGHTGGVLAWGEDYLPW